MARIGLIAPLVVIANPARAAAAEVEVEEVAEVDEAVALRPSVLGLALIVGAAEGPPPGPLRPAAPCAEEGIGWAEACRRPRAKAAPAIGRTGKPAVPKG